VLLIAAPALPVPASLRSEDDVADLAETFMQSVVSNDVRGAYRLVSRYWPIGAAKLAERIEEGVARRATLRSQLGLSLGHELLGSEAAGERVLRIRHLERFDKGALVWRFVFYRAEASWQLVELSETDDLNALFRGP
jgi:hypothetical protein